MTRRNAGVLMGLGALSLASLFLRTRSLDGTLWIDEAISRGIASYPLAEIPGVLRQDGSPPLYYALLHGWMSLAGESEATLRSLSLAFAVAAVPAAFWAGCAAGSERAAWLVATLAAFNPFLTIYGQEARMYSLVALLSIVATGAFVRGFVDGSRTAQAGFAGAVALLLYTHSWASFFLAGSAVALGVIAWRGRPVRPGVVALGAAAVAFVPWLPTLLAQARETGAPWSSTPSLLSLVGSLPASLEGGVGAAAVLAGGAAGLASLRWGGERERTIFLSLGALAASTVTVAWLSSQLEPSWANRYLAIVLGPVLVLGGLGLSRLGLPGLVALALAVVLWTGFRAPADKSNAAAVARELAAVAPASVVVSTQPEQVSLLAYYLGGGYRYATPLGAVSEPRVFDWRHALARLDRARAEPLARTLVDDLRAGERIVLVTPLGGDRGWSAAWQRAVLARSVEWSERLAGDSRLRKGEVIASRARGTTSVRAIVYERR